MTREQQRFIEGMGDHFETQGFPRIGGRLLALLMINPEPASLDELAETLQVSKGSISSNARLLESGGIAERIRPPGDRRDFYQIAEDAQARVMRIQLERMADLQRRLEQGIEAVPRDQPHVRDRFQNMIRTNQEMTAVIRRKMGVGEE
jgi:DNA-binding transcriptional regulator GbsR (MarR family)